MTVPATNVALLIPPAYIWQSNPHTLAANPLTAAWRYPQGNPAEVVDWRTDETYACEACDTPASGRGGN
jgi:hypothetical protein